MVTPPDLASIVYTYSSYSTKSHHSGYGVVNLVEFSVQGGDEAVVKSSRDFWDFTSAPGSTRRSHNYDNHVNASYRNDVRSESQRHATASTHVESICLQRLQNFEMVTEQYRHQGVVFKNAVAIQPSNPAFPARTGQSILLGAPTGGVIELLFIEPVRHIVGYVTSSRLTMMTAFGLNDDIVGQAETLGGNLAGDKSAVAPPHACLALQADHDQIHRVLFRCSGGQVALTELSFSRSQMPAH